MKRALTIAAVAIAVVGVIAVRAVMAGRGAMIEGDAWRQRGEMREAIRSYEAAARWYVPFAPHVDAAYATLRAIAIGERIGHRDTEAQSPELLAWRAIRSAARATRTLWQPHAEDLAEADAAISRLEAHEVGAGAGAGPALADREAWYRARLGDDPRPSLGMAVLAGFGILVGLAGVFVLVLRRPALGAGVAIVVGCACWVVGLYNA